MYLEYESSGGFANLRLGYRADTDSLPPAVAKELVALVHASGALELQQQDIASHALGLPDVLSYRLALHDGEKKNTLLFNDVTAPVSLRPLLLRLQALALDQRQ
jgi:hypothetical protein